MPLLSLLISSLKSAYPSLQRLEPQILNPRSLEGLQWFYNLAAEAPAGLS